MADDTTLTEQTPPASGARSETSSAYLVTIAGLRVGEMFKLTKAVTVLGRSDEVDLNLIDEGVSRRHAAVLFDAGRVVLKDLGSVNGTYCNGVRIRDATVLSDGDKISVGGATILKFTYQDDLEQQLSQSLYESAVKDGLTGLHNRRYFDERVLSEVAFTTRHLSELALVLVDLDHFKRINDERGHQAGDLVLAEVGRRLSSSVRAEDTAVRFGGEEFAILCRDTGTGSALALAERIRGTIANEISVLDQPGVHVTASVGVAVMPRADVKTDADLIRAADAALYLAKHNGRDQAVVFGDERFVPNARRP